MILQALHDYYERASTQPGAMIAPEGWIDKQVDFIIDVDDAGNCVAIKCMQEVTGTKRKAGPAMRLPSIGKQALKHTNSGTDANLLWDNAGFALGLGIKGDLKHASFKKTIAKYVGSVEDEGVTAVTRFLDRIGANPEFRRALLANSPDGPVLETGNPIVAFRYATDGTDLVCQRPAVRSRYDECRTATTEGPVGTCLITGMEDSPIELSHSVLKNVWRGQTSGGAIVSFNCRSFESYGKNDRQGENAPIGKAAAFAYTTALNHLLADESHRVQVGDASTVFWAQKDDQFVDIFVNFFGETDDPDARTGEIRALLEAVKSGKFDGGRGKNRFYVLGLAPNAARIAVRFWHAAPLAEIATRIRDWFDDLAIVRARGDPEYPSVFRLLTAVSVQNKADNIPPNLGGDVMRSILDGTPLPATFLNAAVQRCRAEQKVSYLRAAAIKACLNRRLRLTRPADHKKEFETMLDKENGSTPYRLGRLFAALERIQEEAHPSLNATIRDRYYGAASSAPVTVFTTLLRLKNHHLAKLENRGRAVNFERLLGEIIADIRDFPAHLALPDQGQFALGYYHQRHDF